MLDLRAFCDSPALSLSGPPCGLFNDKISCGRCARQARTLSSHIVEKCDAILGDDRRRHAGRMRAEAAGAKQR
jgi:hypothetical protein